jgi:hypothetical protein
MIACSYCGKTVRAQRTVETPAGDCLCLDCAVECAHCGAWGILTVTAKGCGCEVCPGCVATHPRREQEDPDDVRDRQRDERHYSAEVGIWTEGGGR